MSKCRERSQWWGSLYSLHVETTGYRTWETCLNPGSRTIGCGTLTRDFSFCTSVLSPLRGYALNAYYIHDTEDRSCWDQDKSSSLEARDLDFILNSVGNWSSLLCSNFFLHKSCIIKKDHRHTGVLSEANNQDGWGKAESDLRTDWFHGKLLKEQRMLTRTKT